MEWVQNETVQTVLLWVVAFFATSHVRNAMPRSSDTTDRQVRDFMSASMRFLILSFGLMFLDRLFWSMCAMFLIVFMNMTFYDSVPKKTELHELVAGNALVSFILFIVYLFAFIGSFAETEAVRDSCRAVLYGVVIFMILTLFFYRPKVRDEPDEKKD